MNLCAVLSSEGCTYAVLVIDDYELIAFHTFVWFNTCASCCTFTICINVFVHCSVGGDEVRSVTG